MGSGIPRCALDADHHLDAFQQLGRLEALGALVVDLGERVDGMSAGELRGEVKRVAGLWAGEPGVCSVLPLLRRGL